MLRDNLIVLRPVPPKTLVGQHRKRVLGDSGCRGDLLQEVFFGNDSHSREEEGLFDLDSAAVADSANIFASRAAFFPASAEALASIAAD